MHTSKQKYLKGRYLFGKCEREPISEHQQLLDFSTKNQKFN